MADILIVDDDPHVRILFSEMLSSAGHTVEAAENVTDAVARFQRKQPDLVVTDLMMPDRNGFDLLREVKSISKFTPVIIVTASPSVTAAVECLKSGATDYLSKPVDFEELKRVVEESLRESMSATGMPFLPTHRSALVVAHYTVKRTLGVGTYGVVYLAEDGTDGKLVALKILKTDTMMDSTKANKTKSRFTREAHSISRMQHPNVVRIYEYATDANLQVPYIAMQFVEGMSLKDKLPKLKRLGVASKTRIVIQLAAALQAIHEAGFCHRDIKPHNVMLDADNHVTLTDFGIVSEPDSELTQANDRLGSPAYMAPEAFWDARVDATADQFSLGIVAYQLYLHERPFAATNLRLLAKSVGADKPASPQSHKPAFPIELQAILAVLLRKNPADRYPTTDLLVNDLQAFLDGEPEHIVALKSPYARPIADDWSE